MIENITSKQDALEIVMDLARNPEQGILVQIGHMKDGLTAAEIVLQEIHSFGMDNLPTRLLYRMAERLLTEQGIRVGTVTMEEK